MRWSTLLKMVCVSYKRKRMHFLPRELLQHVFDFLPLQELPDVYINIFFDGDLFYIHGPYKGIPCSEGKEYLVVVDITETRRRGHPSLYSRTPGRHLFRESASSLCVSRDERRHDESPYVCVGRKPSFLRVCSKVWPLQKGMIMRASAEVKWILPREVRVGGNERTDLRVRVCPIRGL